MPRDARRGAAPRARTMRVVDTRCRQHQQRLGCAPTHCSRRRAADLSGLRSPPSGLMTPPGECPSSRGWWCAPTLGYPRHPPVPRRSTPPPRGERAGSPGRI
eukprot:scaffold32958_cov50-Phaeocystis_antarctica.AAC.2